MQPRILRLAPMIGLASCLAAGDVEQSAENVEPNDLNLAAGSMVLYEVQPRVANACDPAVSGQSCMDRAAPTIPYRARYTRDDGPPVAEQCGDLERLKRIRLGTLDDMLENTADFRSGITVRYIDERVGANTIWFMPSFPNNDSEDTPDACDDLGSPYAVRDYMHIAGTLSRSCIGQGRDEYSAEPCWGTGSFEAVIAEAHRRGMKVMLDLAFNHFGRNYLMYDYAWYTPTRERIERGEDLAANAGDRSNADLTSYFHSTEESALIHPELLDSAGKLEEMANANQGVRQDLQALKDKCSAQSVPLTGDALVRAYGMWRNALPWEREQFKCGHELEYSLPGFYLGSNHWDPSRQGPNPVTRRGGDNFTNNWRDVRFLYMHDENAAHNHEYVRNREYLFRVMNYWVSRGVDGFRLDHTSDGDSGIGPSDWKYILSKVDYYRWRRGQSQNPVYLAEEFHDQGGMDAVVDTMTEGYVGDMNGRGSIKNTWRVERVLDNMSRGLRADGSPNRRAFTMTALETHDEWRLLKDTGFNAWTGAGFWGLGAAMRSTPMMLMGQEFGETEQLPFRKAAYLPGRFDCTVRGASGECLQDALVDYYRSFITARMTPENRALLSPSYRYLRLQSNDGQGVDGRVLAMARWSGDGNVMLVFHNLWEEDAPGGDQYLHYYIDPALGQTLGIRDDASYRVYEVLEGRRLWGDECRSGARIKWDLPIRLNRGTRAQWMRLEQCN